MRLYFLIFFIIFTKGLFGGGIFSQKLWNKQRIISEVVKNYLMSCRSLDILKNFDNLRKVVQLGHKQKVNFLDQLEILVDLSKFCGQKELLSAKFGEIDCFEMLKSRELLKLFDEYKIQTEKSEKFVSRLMICKLLFRMDKPKVSDKDVKVLIVNFFIEKDREPINFESKNIKLESYTSNMENETRVNTEQILYNDRTLVLTNSEAAYLLWRLENLLNNLYRLYHNAEILSGLQTNVKTSVNIKKNAVGNTNVRMQTSISSKRLLGDACKIFQSNREIIELVEQYVNKEAYSNVDIVFIKIKKVEDQILKKFLNKYSNFGLTDNSTQNKIISKCMADLLLLTAIIEFYKSLIKSVAQIVHNSKDNSYKIFCHKKEPTCSKHYFIKNLFELDGKAELLTTSINSWFKQELSNKVYKEWQNQLNSNVNGQFPVMIVGENIKPKHGGFVGRVEEGLRSIRKQILSSAREEESENYKKQKRNRRHYFYSSPRIKRPHKRKPKIYYLVDELPRPASYYQKNL